MSKEQICALQGEAFFLYGAAFVLTLRISGTTKHALMSSQRAASVRRIMNLGE
jgi:hypothetical protein